MYVIVNFIDLKASPPLMAPGESIVIRDTKTALAVVENDIVHFRPVQLGRDYGEQTEITSGLQPGEVIVRTVTDDVREGARIQPRFQAQKQSQPSGQRKP